MAKKKGKRRSAAEVRSDASDTSNVQPNVVHEDRFTTLQRHYLWGVQDMDTRRLRKNGWNEIINSYMGKLPVNWPYNAVVTDPRIRTTILEKTSRLLNSKLQGRLVPRKDADIVKAKVNNALLDFQWDFANEGGSMIEKVALADQYCRIFGAASVLVYWDTKKESNEIKIIDPRDLFFDGAATHIKNARWVQVREFTTFDRLEERGYDMSEARAMAEAGEVTAELRSTRYESIVKANRDLVDRTGMIDDLQNPVVEIVTEWGIDKDQKPYCTIFLPKYAMILEDGPSPYKHGRIPISMLRYYPLVDDLYGESEVESVLPLQRAINALLCGFIDEGNIKIRPPLKISSSGVRIETIEYGPGAKWIMNSPDNVVEMEPNGGFISAFQAAYPALLSAYNAAMGDQSQFNDQQMTKERPTATQVVSTEKQQTVRDQYNQLYLSEFLKDIMMMWMLNNRQYLFDDPTKKFYILKIVGKDEIQSLQQLGLDGSETPGYALKGIANTLVKAPGIVSDGMIANIHKNASVPKYPIITNPNDDVKDYDIKSKLDVHHDGHEADLYVVPTDFEGEYDYIPDVKSMAAGMGLQLQQARQKALDFALNPEVIQLLQSQGQELKLRELLVANLEDAGYKDAESLFQPVKQPQNNEDKNQKPPNVSINYKDLPPDGQVQAAREAGINIKPIGLGGPGLGGAGGSINGINGNQGMADVPQTLPNRAVGPGLSPTPGGSGL